MKNNTDYQIEKENDEKNLNYVAQLVNNNDFPEEAKKVVIDNVNAAIAAIQTMRKMVYKALGIEGIKLQYNPHDVLKSNEKNITNPLELKSMAHKIAQIIDYVKNQNKVAPQSIINEMTFKKFAAAENEEFNKERGRVLILSEEIIDKFATKYEGPVATLQDEVKKTNEEILESQDVDAKLKKAEAESADSKADESKADEKVDEKVDENVNANTNENESNGGASNNEDAGSNNEGNNNENEGSGNENAESSSEETQG